MGHDNLRAALIYQHASSEADQGIAASMDDTVRTGRRKPSKRKPMSSSAVCRKATRR